MKFQIAFYGPFRVAAGVASDGLDDAYDPENPLPASSLKGLMRAHASHLLRVQADIVREVFGDVRQRAPWSWTDANLNDQVRRVRTRIRVNEDSSTAADKAMFMGGETWPANASFEVVDRDQIPGNRLFLHETILAASARAVSALGSDRRRGLGWVSIRPERPWDDAQQQLLIQHQRPAGA